MKKLFTLAFTLSALTIASMTLFASEGNVTTTSKPATTSGSIATKDVNVADCNRGLTPEACAAQNGSCSGSTCGTDNGRSTGNGRGCCNN